MPRKIRGHLPDGGSSEPQAGALTDLKPAALTKQDFGRRLYNLMLERGWNQSDLARAAGVARDRVSTYIRGAYLPTPPILEALAKALDVPQEKLLPNYTKNAIENDEPSFEYKVSPGNEKVAWLRVNRLVSTITALKIHELLIADETPSHRE